MNKLSTLLKDSLIFRIIIAISLIVMSLLPLFSEPLITVMLSFSLLLVEIDILLNAYDHVLKGEFLNQFLLVAIGSILLFVFGMKIDSIITVVVFHISLKITDNITKNHIKNAQKELIDSEYDSISALYDVIEDDNLNQLTLETVMLKTCYPVFIILIGLAILFAVLMPFIHNLSLAAAMKRSVSIIIISSPLTMLLSYRIVATSAVLESGLNGIILKNIQSLENVNTVKSVILDDDIAYHNSKSKIIYCHSYSMNNDSLLNFIFHVVYYSDQDFSKTIKNEVDFKYQNGLVFNHLDIPNYGIKAEVNNMRIIFGNEMLCNKFGIDVSNEDNNDLEGDYYYLCIADRCVGCIVLSNQSVINMGEIINSFEEHNIQCNYFSEIDQNSSINTNKLSIFYLNNINKCINSLNYTISESDKDFDGNIHPDFINNISLIPDLANRVEEVAKHNSFISFGIKVFIVIITILGFCTPWLALIIDFGSAIIIMIYSKSLYINGPISSLLRLFKR